MAQAFSLFSRGSAEVAGALSAAASRSGPAESGSWLQRALSRADPLFQFDWDVQLQVGGVAHRPEYIETVNIPGPHTATEAIYRGGTRIYVATTWEVGAVSIRMYEDQALTSTKFLQSWWELIHRPNGDHGLPAEYRGVLEVYPCANNVQLARATCINVFPTQQPSMAFGDDSARVALEVEFSCDRVDWEFF